jgi:micrococcal nuclease
VVVVVAASVIGVSAASSASSAVVERVIDGDTVDVRYDGATHRVRLLNVDTPETVDPDKPVQCLGAEATEFLRQRLPEGTPVRLRFDKDRHDRYNRVLAGVFAQGVLINAEIARAGLGVAVIYEPNRRFYAAVLTAQEEAERLQIGLYSEHVNCTLPAQVSQAAEDAEALTDPVPGGNVDAIERHAAAVAAALVASKALAAIVVDPSIHFPDRTYRGVLHHALTTRMQTAIQTLNDAALNNADAHRQEVARAQAERVRAERVNAEKAARVAAVNAARVAAEKAAKRTAAEAAARTERDNAQERAEAAARQAATDARLQQQRNTSTPRSPSSVAPKSGGSDNYTGCRAYGPQGTSIDSKGRRYTRISC